MSRKRDTPEQIIRMLREAEVLISRKMALRGPFLPCGTACGDSRWSRSKKILFVRLRRLPFRVGLEFYRHGGFVKRLERLGKPMIAHYHGQDFRNRGVIPAVDSQVPVSLTTNTI